MDINQAGWSNDTSSNTSPPHPALVRTPPSTTDLLNPFPFPDNTQLLTTTPPRGSINTNVANSSGSDSTTPSSQQGRRFGTVPFPSKMGFGSSNSPDSHISEQPDTLPSLMRGNRPPTSPNWRGISKTSVTSFVTGRRTHSDPAEPSGVLSASSSRDVTSGTPKRVSFDSESLQNVPGAPANKPDPPSRVPSSLERVLRSLRPAPASDPVLPLHTRPASNQNHSPHPPNSNINSRAQSPLRPFESLLRNPYFWPPANRHETFRPCDPYDVPPSPGRHGLYTRSQGVMCGWCSVAGIPISLPTGDTLWMVSSLVVRQLYRHFLLRLPSLYFARVWRILLEAQVSKPEIDQMIAQRQVGREFPLANQWVSPVVPPGLSRFKQAWEEFVETLLKEWKTLNVVSALLLSAILTIFQIDGTQYPVTRTAALSSLVCGLMSLIYGCVYVVRFTAMKNMRKAARWAEEAQRTTGGIFWNVWVFLSLPAIFLAYSVIFFCVAAMSYVWTTGVNELPAPISDDRALYPRIAITALFALGIIYFYMVVTTFRSYADPWPDDRIFPPDSSSGNNGGGTTEGEVERGRSMETELERERRISLRRFGSPDVLTRAFSREKASGNLFGAPVAEAPGGAGIASGAAGGFAPRTTGI